MQKFPIVLWMNGKNDWSIEVNGFRHEHISSKVVKELVESAVVEADTERPDSGKESRQDEQDG